MKVTRILGKSPVARPFTRPVATVAKEPEIWTPPPADDLYTFSDKPTHVLYHWKIAARVFGRKCETKYATHVGVHDYGQCAQEAWSRYVWKMLQYSPDLPSPYFEAVDCLRMERMKVCNESFEADIPLLPSRVIVPKDTLSALLSMYAKPVRAPRPLTLKIPIKPK
ncbi:MAG: hypothetical protein ABW007_19005 [Chitinophagaceae bacterium]